MCHSIHVFRNIRDLLRIQIDFYHKYHHEILGRNSRLDTIQAAILDTKLKTLDIDNEKRRNNVKIYKERLSKLPKEELILPLIEEDAVINMLKDWKK